MRKFNLEEAKAGKPVVTRTGRPVRILCWDAKGRDPIVALIELETTSYVIQCGKDGFFTSEDIETDQDLFMKSEVKEGYIFFELSEVYKKTGIIETFGVFKTFEDAAELANSYNNPMTFPPTQSSHKTNHLSAHHQ